MIKRNWTITMVLMLIVSTNTITAQIGEGKKENVTVKNTDPLKGLKRVSFKDLKSDDKQVLKDLAILPNYSEDHVLIDKQDFEKMMSSGDYKLDIYADDTMEAKALVLRKVTEKEKKYLNKEKRLRSLNRD